MRRFLNNYCIISSQIKLSLSIGFTSHISVQRLSKDFILKNQCQYVKACVLLFVTCYLYAVTRMQCKTYSLTCLEPHLYLLYINKSANISCCIVFVLYCMLYWYNYSIIAQLTNYTNTYNPAPPSSLLLHNYDSISINISTQRGLDYYCSAFCCSSLVCLHLSVNYFYRSH